MRKLRLSFLTFLILLLAGKSYSQISLTATAGTTTATYTTLGAAFAAINAGTHQGAITIQVTANTTETGPCVLNSGSGDAAPANYTSVSIAPTTFPLTISGPTVAGRGLIELNGADNVTIDGDVPGGPVNHDLTITNTAAAATQFTSVIRLVTGTGVTSTDNITIKNLNLNGSAVGLNASANTTGAVQNTMGVYAGGGANGATVAPAALAAVNTTGSTFNGLTITNNIINACARGVSVNGTAATAINTLTITNNVIGSSTALTGNPPFTTPTNTVYTVGITFKGATTANITGNTIQDIVSYSAQPIRGVEVVGACNTVNINNNTITGVVANGTGATSDDGIFLTSGSMTTCNVLGNSISNIQCMSTSAAVGINVQNVATISKNNITKVYNRNTGTYTAKGIVVTTANNVVITNNFVSDVNIDMSGGFAFGTLGVKGIELTGGTGHQVYHNSVNLFGTFFGAANSSISSAAFEMTSTAITGCDVRNNIFADNMTGGTTSIAHVSMLLPSGATSAMNLTLNNNAYYSGTVAGQSGIAHVGTSYSAANLYTAANFNPGTTTPSTNLRAYTSTLSSSGTNDNASYAFSSAVPFVSNTDLHIPNGTATPLESGGASVGVTTDIDGQTRPGPAGSVNGGGVLPDIGADEFDGIPVDLIAPGINYTALAMTCTFGNRTITATLTDVSGVPTSGSLVPRIYYRKNSGTWFSQPGTLTSGTATNGTWSFNIVSADMGGVVVGDVVSYFIIAQDLASTPNIGANPGSGLVASDVNTITTFPTSPNTYTIQNTLGGTYTVGAGQTYSTISAAVNAYNNSCLSAPIVFSLTDNVYVGETAPITINANAYSSATNTLTIQPATGATPIVIANSTNGIFVLNGADYVTINGSNNPVTNSICPRVIASRNMTVLNTNSSTTSAVIWLQTSSTSDPATNNTIMNLNVVGSGNAQTLFGIGSGGTSISYTSLGNGNNNNSFINNNITATQTGIYSMGNSAVNKNQNTVINQNVMNGTGSNALRNNGIFTGFENNLTISGNTIANITNAVSNDIIGINLGFGNNSFLNTNTTGNEVTNAMVTYNKLDNITQTNTFSVVGIAVAGPTSGTNTIANNMVNNIGSNSTASDIAVGIFIGGNTGGTTNVFYNTVRMAGTFTGGSVPSFAFAVSGSNPVVNVKNNIFISQISNGYGSNFVMGFAYSTFSNLVSNNNDLYSSTNLVQVGALSTAGAGYGNLSAWQAASGEDANSVNINPTFVSTTDLHLTSVTANAALSAGGTPVAVTTDFDCITRGTPPTIGINEIVTPITLGTTPTFCQGTTSVTVTYTGAQANATKYNITWSSAALAAGFANVSAATLTGGNINLAIPATAPAATYTGTVTASNGSVNSAGTPLTVTVTPLPSLTSATTNSPICVGTTLTLNANGATNVTGYSWAGPVAITGATTASASVPAATLAANGTYSVTVNNGAGIGCTVTYTTSATVNALPNLSSLATGSPFSTCQNTAIAVTVTSSSLGTGTFTVTYNVFGANTATGNTATMVMSGGTGTFNTSLMATPGLTGVQITSVTNAAGCSSTPAGGNTTSFNVIPTPTVFNVTGGGAYCAGGSGVDIMLDSSESGVDYQLYNGATLITTMSGIDAPLDFGLQTAAGTYTIVGVNSISACQSNMAGSATITINPLPAAITGTTNVCVGSTTTLNETSTGGAWSSGNVALATVDATTGVVTGVSAGDVMISYTLPTTCFVTTTVTVNPLPATIGGSTAVCEGSITTLTNTSTGGTWSSSDITVATVDATTGDVTGVLAGTAVVTYTLPTGCSATTTVTVNPLPAAITGTMAICEASMTTLADASIGGTWSSSDATIANIDVSTGDVTGVAAGTATITYMLTTGCIATSNFTVNPLPGTITGTMNVCEGSVTTLADATAGGTWSSSDVTIATVDATTGDVTGVLAGTATITYALPTGCVATTNITVNTTPVAITGIMNVCEGSVTTLSDATPGGAWSSSDVTVATIDATTGDVTGITAGNAVITYALTTGCQNTASVTVNPLPDAITGTTTLCEGSTTTLSNAVTGGTWSSSNVTIATIDATTGIVNGIAGGTADITYSLSTGCTATTSVLVNPLPVMYTVTGGGNYCAGGTGVSVGLSGSVSGIRYQLFNGATMVGTPLDGTGSALDFGLQTAAGTYTVLATDSTTGCNRNMIASAIVGVYTLPSIYSVTGGGNYCAGGAGVHVGLGGSNIGINYQLYNGASTVGAPVAGTGVPLDFGLFTPAGTYSVVATNATTGCVQNMLGAAIIVVNPLVTPSVSILEGPNDTVCAGTSVTFTAIPTNGGAAPTFSWMVNGTSVGSGNSYMYIPSNSDVVAVKLTSSDACAVPDSAMSSVIMTVNPNVTSSVTIAVGPGNILCEGSPATFSATVVNGGTAPIYRWMKNGVVASTGTTFSYIPANGDDVVLILTSALACSLPATAVSNHITMEVDPAYIPSVEINVNPGTRIGAGQTVTFNTVVTNGGPNPTYQWYKNATLIAGATNATYTTTTLVNNDSISVVVKGSGSCGMETFNGVKITVHGVSVDPVNTIADDVNVMPNPNKGDFIVKGTLGSATDQKVTFEVTNMLGQIVYNNTVMIDNGILNEHIQLSKTLASGVYLLNMHTDHGNKVFHIVIEQ